MDKAEKAKQMRYRRPALDMYGWTEMYYKLLEIQGGCQAVHYFMDTDDEGTLLNAFDGDSDEEEEFKIAFAELEGKAYQLQSRIDELSWEDGIEQRFNDCTVALLGNRYNVVGYDSLEEDYVSLSSWGQELADKGAQERLMRMTKKDMISNIGQCMGVLLSFYDLLQDYDCLSVTMDILKGENTQLLDNIKKLFKLYDKMKDGDYQAKRDFQRIINELPDKCWLY